MLPYYDARAVADVLGLAFIQVQRKSRQPASIEDFIIGSDERFVVVVQAVDQRPDRIDRSLNRLAPSAAYIEQAVEIGLPRVALRRLVELLVGDDKSKISTLEWDVVPRTTLERRKSKLSPQPDATRMWLLIPNMPTRLAFRSGRKRRSRSIRASLAEASQRFGPRPPALAGAQR